MASLFELEPDHQTIVIDETKMNINDREVYVWAAIDVDTVEVSSDRCNLNTLLFPKQVLGRCRGKPTILVDLGLWYNRLLDGLDLPCESPRDTWGERCLVEAWFGMFKYRARLFYSRFPHRGFWQSTDHWVTAFAAFHNAILLLCYSLA